MNPQNALHTVPELFQSNTEQFKIYETVAFAEQHLQHTISAVSPDSPHSTDSNDHDTKTDVDTIHFTRSRPESLSNSADEIFAKHGYKKISKISNTLQGQIYKAQEIATDKLVAIKSANKLLFSQGIAIEGDITFCVSENIIKEALILQYLTIDNKCIGGYVLQFINFFESQSSYYLVIEYIASEINLKQFVNIAFKHLQNGTLKLKTYQKTIKYIYWQLSVTVQWLHESMKCCHLDLCLENIMLANCELVLGKDDYYKVNPTICIKLIDFGVSEFFHINTSFSCNKQSLSLENEPYSAPEVYSDAVYNAPSADMWSLGIILYECLTAKRLYKPMEIWQYKALQSRNIALSNNGYWSLHNNKLATYISVHDMDKFDNNSMDLLMGLLNVSQKERLSSNDVLRHKWFKMYFDHYREQITKKAMAQKEQLQKQQRRLRNFPFYKKM